MKNTHQLGTILGCTAIALAITAPLTRAGVTEVVETPPPPVASPSLWQWFVGGSGGYLFDAENEIWTGHLGVEWTNGDYSHAIYLEGGWTEFDEQALLRAWWDPDDDGIDPDFGVPVLGIWGGYDIDIDVVPVTLNYKFEGRFGSGSCWGYYLGFGLGAAFTDTSIGWYSDDNTLFYGQVFGGLVWNISEAFEIFAGLRYVYMEDVDDHYFDIGGLDDGMAEVGLRFNF